MRPGPLRELALLFLRLGATSFGGPAAHIALMEDEVVRRRRWLSREDFLDLLGATNLIPGPSSTELAIHIGHRRAGWPGLLVAGACFILPATVIVAVIAWAYVRFGRLPAVSAILYGIKPVMIAIVIQALWALGRTAIRNAWLAVLAAAGLAAAFLRVNELAILAGCGLLAAGVATARRQGAGTNARALLPLLPALPLGSAAATTAAAVTTGAAAAVPVQLTTLFLVFAKTGAVLFGSGYVLLAFLRADLVQRLGWLTEGQLLDAIAVGQVTPGPVFTTATFVGYVLGGLPGALAATAGIFLPAFVFVAVSGPLVPRIRRSRVAGAFLDGVNVASLALMAAVTWQLGRSALVDLVTMAMATCAAILLLWRRWNSLWLVTAGALVGLAVQRGSG